MKFIFVRHGESEGNHFGLIQGHLDFHLSDEGRKQALTAASEIKKTIGNDKPLIFSSDLSRAWETAVIISESLHLQTPIPDRRLRERHMGILQDQHWTKINWEIINSPRPLISGLETRDMITKRIFDFVQFSLNQVSPITDTIIAVTHGGTLTFLYHFLLETKFEDIPHLPNASVHSFKVSIGSNKIKARPV